MKINWLWDTQLDEKRVKKILHNERDPRFFLYAEKLFSRVKDPKIAFEFINRDSFCREWHTIKKRIQKDTWAKVKTEFWQQMYEKVLKDSQFASERVSIAQQIKNIRIQLGYTQKDMAEKLGVIQQYISKLETGRENLTIDTLKRIAGILQKKLIIQFR